MGDDLVTQVDLEEELKEVELEEFDELEIDLPGSYLDELYGEQALQLVAEIRTASMTVRGISRLNPSQASAMNDQITSNRRVLSVIKREHPHAIALVPELAAAKAKMAKNSRKASGIG